MNWFETRPLFGQTIVVTRARDQASELTAQLEALGANVLEAPSIELVAVDDIAPLREALQHPYDWLIFTSVNGVRFAKQRLFDMGLDVRVFGNAKLAAIGEPTAVAIREQLGLKVDLVPKRFVAESLAEELISQFPVQAKSFLLLRADIARPLLKERLKEAGAKMVLDIPIYETKSLGTYPPDIINALEKGDVDWVTFTSSSTVKNFTSSSGNSKFEKTRFASIGPITSSTMVSAGLIPDVEAEHFTIAGLVASILQANQ